MANVINSEALDTMPQFRKDNLARFTLELVDAIFQQPGEEENYQAWLKDRKARHNKMEE